MGAGCVCVLALLGWAAARALDVPTRMELREVRRFPKDRAELTPAAVQAAGAQCRRTVTIGLLGEQATLDRLVPSG